MYNNFSWHTITKGLLLILPMLIINVHWCKKKQFSQWWKYIP